MKTVILAFSNDKDQYLEMINRERKTIFKTLQNHHDRGYIRVHKEESTSIEDIFQLFNRYDQIAIFHYGGHANGTHLQLETGAGESQLANAVGLAQLLGQQKELKLVFLNGCATLNQVELLLSSGVRAVIATSAAIDDRMATEFAEQFYNALVGQSTIEKAFEVAKAFIATRYGQSKEINLYRDISWERKPAAAKNEIAWGLYTNENSREVLGWKLPETPCESVIIRGSAVSYTDSVQVNTQLIETLFTEVARHSIEVGYLLEAYKKSKRMDIRMVRQAIIDSLPIPVGEQLRRLFAGTGIDVDRLRQLVLTYNTIIELLCFTMVSQLWEAKFKNPGTLIADHYLVQLKSFFALNADNYRKFNYVKLIEAIAGIFKENKIKPFVEELSMVEESLQAKDEFYNAYRFMEEMKLEIIEEQVKASEIESFCVQADEHLGTVLKKLAFIVKYKLTTIKLIEIINPRHKKPKFLHKWVLLDRITAGILDEQVLYDSFTDNDSVILLKSVDNVAEYLSFSPFIIDENALTRNQNSKLFYYTYQDISSGNDCYYYKFIDNEEEKLIVSETKYPQVKEQFEEFKENMK